MNSQKKFLKWFAIPLERWEAATGKPFARVKETGVMSWNGKKFVLVSDDFLKRTKNIPSAQFRRTGIRITENGVRFPKPKRR